MKNKLYFVIYAIFSELNLQKRRPSRYKGTRDMFNDISTPRGLFNAKIWLVCNY